MPCDGEEVYAQWGDTEIKGTYREGCAATMMDPGEAPSVEDIEVRVGGHWHDPCDVRDEDGEGFPLDCLEEQLLEGACQ